MWGGPLARSRTPGGSCFQHLKPAGSRLGAGSPPHMAVFTQARQLGACPSRPSEQAMLLGGSLGSLGGRWSSGRAGLGHRHQSDEVLADAGLLERYQAFDAGVEIRPREADELEDEQLVESSLGQRDDAIVGKGLMRQLGDGKLLGGGGADRLGERRTEDAYAIPIGNEARCRRQDDSYFFGAGHFSIFFRIASEFFAVGDNSRYFSYASRAAAWSFSFSSDSPSFKNASGEPGSHLVARR